MAAERPQTHFPFGKHKGTPIDDVPTEYLVWALENMDGLRPATRLMIDASLNRRGSHGERSTGKRAQAPARRATSSGQLLPCPACGSMLAVSLNEPGAGDPEENREEVPF